MLFISPQNLFSFSNIYIFNKKDIVNFKIYDVTTWLVKNCNTQIDQYLKK